MTLTRFRQLLILFVALSFAAVAVTFLPGGHSQDLADAYANESDIWFSRYVWLLLGLAIPLSVAGIAGFVGLFLFKTWGRPLSLYSTVGGLILIPIAGPTLYTALESALWEASSLVWGAILALAYFSAVADRFDANNSFKPKPLRGSA